MSLYFKPWRMSVEADLRLWRFGFSRPRPHWQSYGIFLGPVVVQFWVKNGTARVVIPAYSSMAAPPEEPRP